MASHHTIAFLLAVGTTVGCSGGGDDPLAGADPRCAAICTPEEPDVEGAFDICSTASVGSCVDQCEARIESVETVCATCLLEDASFGLDDDVFVPDQCEPSGICTMQGREGYCTYPQGDESAREDCYREVFPRREVACDVEFRPVAECSGTCS